MRGIRFHGFVAVAAAGLAAVLGGASVSAAAVVRTPAGSAVTAPSGYVIERASFTVSGSPNTAAGQASCPAGKVVWGGGVGWEDFFDNDTLNTSEFAGTSEWFATVNNPDTSTTAFRVDAICAAKPKGYQSVSTLVDDPAGTQTTGSATCPSGTVLLSGSVLSHGDTNSEYLTSEWPSSTRTFTVSQENASTSDVPFGVAVLCAKKPAGYTLVVAHASAPALQAGVPVAACPSGTSVIGGGVHVATPQALVNPVASIDNNDHNAWLAYVENGTAATVAVAGYAICAA